MNNDSDAYYSERAKKILEEKMECGHFWFPEGAIADARVLALTALRHFQIMEALTLLIRVHARAATRAKERLEESPEDALFERWYKESNWAVFVYDTILKFLSFFSLL